MEYGYANGVISQERLNMDAKLLLSANCCANQRGIYDLLFNYDYIINKYAALIGTTTDDLE